MAQEKLKGYVQGAPAPAEDIGTEDQDANQLNLLRVARERYRKALDGDRDNRLKALEDLEFYAGDQWPNEIRLEREADSRPILTINRLPQFVRQVTGDIRRNRPSIKVKPADDVSDMELADVFAGLVRQIEAQSDASDAYQTGADGAAQCGIGHFRICTEYADDDTFEQNIRIRRITDQFAVTWDPQAELGTRADAAYVFVEEEYDIENFKARWPDAKTQSDFDFQNTNWSFLGDWLRHETVRVAEYWTKTPEKRTLARMQDGRVIDVTDLEEDQGVYYDGETPLGVVEEIRKITRNKIEMRLINGAEVLEGPFEWQGKYFPIVPVMGEEVHIGRRTLRHGVIRHAKDPQRMYNYWRTAQTEGIALQPKAPFIATAKNIAGYEDIWKSANVRNTPYLPYTPDEANGGVAPQRQSPQLASSGMAQEVMVAAEDMKATTGIYDAGLGARSNETSGKAIQARQQESDVGTYVWIDNVNRAIRHGGIILVDLIPKIYDSERVIRILNEDGTSKSVEINQRVTDKNGDEILINDLTAGKYDVTISTGPSYSTRRSEASDGMVAFVQAVPQVGNLIMDIIAENQDWPGAAEIAKRLRKALPPGLVEPREGEAPPPPPPPDPKIIEAAANVRALGVKTESDRLEAEAKVGKLEAETAATELENMQQSILLSLQTGEMKGFIEAQVMKAVVGILREQALPDPPQPPPQPPSPAEMGGGVTPMVPRRPDRTAQP